MTSLEKAEAVLAAFRGDVECPNCHEWRPKEEIEEFALFYQVGHQFVRICYQCWQKGVEDKDKVTALVRRYERPRQS